MVAGGIGVTVLPATSVNAADEQLLTIRPLAHPVPTRRVVLAWRRNFPRREAIEAVRQAILHSGLAPVTMLPDAQVE
jgi:LysR family hydrogen peroxide-inducible transcriptional activator